MGTEIVRNLKPARNMETVSRYFISICLTITIFGLGYFCGNRAEKESSFHVSTPATSADDNTSRTSMPAATLRQQHMPRKAGMLV